MNDEELREAAELAGLVWTEHPDNMDRVWCSADGDWPWYTDDPALPAYVASLLVARVNECNAHRRNRYANLMEGTLMLDVIFATETQRIRAAVKVLKP